MSLLSRIDKLEQQSSGGIHETTERIPNGDGIFVIDRVIMIQA